MTTLLDRIIFLAKKSGQLSEQELIDLTSALLWADDGDLLPLEKLIQRRPESFQWLLQNLQSKQHALQSKDSNAWDQILQQEKEWIESL